MLHGLLHSFFKNAGPHEARTANIEVLLKAEMSSGTFSGKVRITYWCHCGAKLSRRTARVEGLNNSSTVTRNCLNYAMAELWALASASDRHAPIYVTGNSEMVAQVLNNKHKNIVVIP